MFRGYRHKYKNLSETDSNLNWHLEQSRFPHFHPSSSQPHCLGLLLGTPGTVQLCRQHCSHSTATYIGWKLQSQLPRINYSVELVHICHSHRNNHLCSGNYSISRNKPCSSELPREWFFEFTIKHLSQDSRTPLAFSLYPEAPQTNKDPLLPLFTAIHLHSGPRGQGQVGDSTEPAQHSSPSAAHGTIPSSRKIFSCSLISCPQTHNFPQMPSMHNVYETFLYCGMFNEGLQMLTVEFWVEKNSVQKQVNG